MLCPAPFPQSVLSNFWLELDPSVGTDEEVEAAQVQLPMPFRFESALHSSKVFPFFHIFSVC